MTLSKVCCVMEKTRGCIDKKELKRLKYYAKTGYSVGKHNLLTVIKTTDRVWFKISISEF